MQSSREMQVRTENDAEITQDSPAPLRPALPSPAPSSLPPRSSCMDSFVAEFRARNNCGHFANHLPPRLTHLDTVAVKNLKLSVTKAYSFYPMTEAEQNICFS